MPKSQTSTNPGVATCLPPSVRIGPIGWMRENLFSTTLNTLLTFLAGWLLILAVPALFEWAFFEAKFFAKSGL